jgi:hypothetical protein
MAIMGTPKAATYGDDSSSSSLSRGPTRCPICRQASNSTTPKIRTAAIMAMETNRPRDSHVAGVIYAQQLGDAFGWIIRPRCSQATRADVDLDCRLIPIACAKRC